MVLSNMMFRLLSEKLAVLFLMLVVPSTLTAAQVSVDDIAKFQKAGEEINHLSLTGAQYSLGAISKKGKMAPFAMVLNKKNKLKRIEPDLPYLKSAPIGDKINFLRGQIKSLAERGSIKAGAVFSRGFGRAIDGKTEMPGIIVELEHIEGTSTIQFVPYEDQDGTIVALEATSRTKPWLFFNSNISSLDTYMKIKNATNAQ